MSRRLVVENDLKADKFQLANQCRGRFGGLRRSSIPPVIRQKPGEQTRTNVNNPDRETLILLEFSDRVLRS